MTSNLKNIATSYFEALKSHDFEALRSLMIDNTTFIGPLAKCTNAEECMHGLRGLASIATDIVIKHMWIDNFDVLTWFELNTTKTVEPLSICNWMHIEKGKITSIKVTFDPRALLVQ